jgi:beta-carotene 3-hydroxylase
MLGMMNQKLLPVWIGFGIAAYGLAYFLIHDIIIHQRFKIWTHWNNRYVRAIRRAHKMHHKHLGKEQGENFGMLIVPIKYWKDPTTSK